MIVIGVLTALLGCTTPGAEPDDSGAAAASRSPERDAPLTVQEALHVGTGQVQVRGYVLIAADQVTRLCTGLAGSFPPQCGTPALVVRGLTADAIPNRESAEGVVWGGEITLQGTIADGVLSVT
jgi:hypothetical protein